MFNVSFGEILVFLIIALIILGPEKFPETLRTILLKYRKFKSLIDKVQQDIENEFEIIELKKFMQKEIQRINANEQKLKDTLLKMQLEIEHSYTELHPRISSSAHQYIFISRENTHIHPPYIQNFQKQGEVYKAV